MIMTRSHAVTAAVAAAAALTATGITYATAAPAPQAAPAAAVQQAPAQAPMDGGTQSGNGGKGNEGNDHGNDHGRDHDRGGRDYDKGWIHINERSFSAHTRGCAVIVSGLGSTSLNIRNDSKKTIEVFRGVTCDNGAPIATVGPHSTSFGVTPERVKGVHVKDGVVGSFRVVDRHEDDYGDRGGDHGGNRGGDKGDDRDDD